MNSSIFIEPQEVVTNLDDYVFLDCRYRLTESNYGNESFKKSCIPGAFYMDLNRDMASMIRSQGGRHPLPELDRLRNKLESFGITNNTQIICYDDNLSGSARMYLLLEILGLNDVRILNGGFPRWLELGFKTSQGDFRSVKRGKIDTVTNLGIIASHNDILEDKNKTVIDARERYRYLGIQEPIDKIPGRIPGAVNIPYTDLMDGISLKDQSALRILLGELKDGDILYCGSGVTSCINYIAMKLVDLQPRIYIGSYSDWISRNLPVETGEE